MSDLKIGVVGSGGRGGLASHAHTPGEGSRIVACCDINQEALASNRESYGADIFTTSDYKELLKQDIDAVFVTTPDFLHEEQAVAALQTGKAVYLEKPMAITIEGCDRILRAAKDHNARLYLGHNMRHMVFVLKMKELIDDGAIGEVKTAWCRHFVGNGGDWYFKDWHAERRYSTSLLLQKSAHDIDVMHWLCGGYTELVCGMGGLTLYDKITDRYDPSKKTKGDIDYSRWPPLSQTEMNPNIDVEDISMMMMRYDNGVFAAYQQCHYAPENWRNYTIIGTEGRIENIGNERTVRLWNKRSTGPNPEGNETFDASATEGGHAGADPKIVAEFVRYAREGGRTSTSPVAARYSVAAGCMAAASLRNGSMPMHIPPLDPELREWFENN